MLIHLDTCLPDYFQGFAGPVYAVPVDGSSTYRDVLEGLRQDINNTYDGAEFDVETELGILFADVKDMDAIFDPSLEVRTEDDYSESVYAYFGWVED